MDVEEKKELKREIVFFIKHIGQISHIVFLVPYRMTKNQRKSVASEKSVVKKSNH